MTIRLGSSSDLAQLIALETASFSDDAFSARRVRYLLQSARCICFVAVEDGQIAGYSLALLHSRRPGLRLYSLCVAAAFRSRGIGKALIAQNEAHAKELGKSYISLEVRADNEIARRLYISQGFAEASVLANYYGHDQPGIKLLKNLASTNSI